MWASYLPSSNSTSLQRPYLNRTRNATNLCHTQYAYTSSDTTVVPSCISPTCNVQNLCTSTTHALRPCTQPRADSSTLKGTHPSSTPPTTPQFTPRTWTGCENWNTARSIQPTKAGTKRRCNAPWLVPRPKQLPVLWSRPAKRAQSASQITGSFTQTDAKRSAVPR